MLKLQKIFGFCFFLVRFTFMEHVHISVQNKGVATAIFCMDFSLSLFLPPPNYSPHIRGNSFLLLWTSPMNILIVVVLSLIIVVILRRESKREKKKLSGITEDMITTRSSKIVVERVKISLNTLVSCLD